MADLSPVNRRRRALLSVTDKSGLAELAASLRDHQYDLLASGGTAAFLRKHDFDVTAVSDLTGYPAIFGGRVKTLHPVIHGGILGPQEQDFAEVAELGIQPIDLVCVNLYQFVAAVAAGGDSAEIVEKIDIGGPTLLRAAAKNFQRVAVLPDPAWYPECIRELAANGGDTSLDFRRRLAGAVFEQVTEYDRAIAAWFNTAAPGDQEGSLAIPLRYGENPHQAARLELPAPAQGQEELETCGLRLHGGKPLSYNNLVDLIAALKLALDFTSPGCAVIKHTNPCGFGLGEPSVALERALRCDPVSAFGGVFVFNAPLDLETAEGLRKRFLEIIAAPAIAEDALKILRKKKNVRLLTFDRGKFLAATDGQSRAFGRVVLHQDEDAGFPELKNWRVVAGPEPDAALTRALTLAWKVCKHVKSNAIVLADAECTLGVGAGQMSRVDSARLAIHKAGEQGIDLNGVVAASDGFFPFPDSIELFHGAGIRAVISPAGSIRDDEVAARAQELGVTLVFCDRRHFRH
ncbi:MAG: bifunctional phosphoribosylaminoimidazolecarboxamide formyltransferase/IMP cyclohydrolase [bacterium]